MELKAKPLIAGAAAGEVLRLVRPLSFWGGVDPATGRIIDRGSDAAGASIAGRVLVLAETRGSSSSSAVMLELIYKELAPAALIVAEPDAILILGALVAGEMNWPTIPVLALSVSDQERLDTGAPIEILADGTIRRRLASS